MLPVGTSLEQKRFPQATLTLIVANVLVFLIELFAPDVSLDWIGKHLAFGPRNISLFAFLASLFLHADVYHLVGNMLYLWIFGAPVEDRVGKKHFVLYYFGAGMVANILFTVMEYARTDAPNSAGIGASGAISGIMAIYLYRCFYSKLKMVLSPVFFPVRFNIPAAPLILFWFFQDLLHGMASLSSSRSGGVAHWAHIGGFLFGFAISRINRFGHEGAVEHFSDRLMDRLRAGDGWKSIADDRELQKLLKLKPDDPEIHLQLAQFYAAKGRLDKATDHYHTAIQRFFAKTPLYGAYAVLDRLRTLKRPMGLHHHLKAAELLVVDGSLEEAHAVLLPVLDGTEPAALAERARILYIKVCRYLRRDDEAAAAVDEFRRTFPRSSRLREADAALTLEAGRTSPPKRPETTEAPQAAVPGTGNDPSDSKALDIGACAGSLVTDPLFVFVWLGSTFLLSAFLGSIWTQVIVFAAALSLTAFIRIDWAHAWRMMTVDEKRSRREADHSMLLNRASLAERGENYSKAAGFYEEVLTADPANFPSRFNLARLYLNRLNDRESAVRHLKLLAGTAPKDHPYRAFAVEELGKIAGRS